MTINFIMEMHCTFGFECILHCFVNNLILLSACLKFNFTWDESWYFMYLPSTDVVKKNKHDLIWGPQIMVGWNSESYDYELTNEDNCFWTLHKSSLSLSLIHKENSVAESRLLTVTFIVMF